MDCAEIRKKYDIPIISDKNTRTSSDTTKTLTTSTSTIILRNILNGTDENPGSTITKNRKRYKFYNRITSLNAPRHRKSKENNPVDTDDDLNNYITKSIKTLVPYKNSITNILIQITNRIHSRLNYCGSHTIPQIQTNSEFIKISRPGFAENQPHDVDVV
jgi:IMP dehydrogenase/GMP reductase